MASVILVWTAGEVSIALCTHVDASLVSTKSAAGKFWGYSSVG